MNSTYPQKVDASFPPNEDLKCQRKRRINRLRRQTGMPGGIMLLHAYTPKQVEYGTGGPLVPELMYTKEMLGHAFAETEILRLEEYETELQEGAGHSGISALIDKR